MCKRWYNKEESKLTTEEKTLLFFTTDDITKLTKISGGDDILENTFDSLKNGLTEKENIQLWHQS